MATARLAASRPDAQLDRALRTCEELNVKAAWFGSSNYPGSLASIPDPPAILFYRGSASLGSLPDSVAMIGSRRCSLYGRRTARTLARELALCGIAVVSGMARGIDSEAHMGAVEGGGVTVAVLGSGVDVIYPPEHERLSRSIIERGLLVSEYPPGTTPARHTFPERNRIISGLARAVVVVEAGEKSGTMITVGTALDQGREVLAVPGEITRSSAVGSNRLIRDGAGMVLETADILRAMGVSVPVVCDEVPADPLLALIRVREATPGELCRVMGVPEQEIRARLLDLELRGLAVRRAGGLYSGV